jgi:hypothetical protein
VPQRMKGHALKRGASFTASVAPTSTQPETQAEPIQSEPPTPNAERRQLTVMFCGQLDPEVLRDVIAPRLTKQRHRKVSA